MNGYIYIYIYISHHHHHHHIALVAWISLTLSRHFSLSFIALGRSSGQHPVSSHSCWMYVRAGRPAFARPWVGVHKSTSLMSSSLLLQQCHACTHTHTHTHTHTRTHTYIYIYIYMYIYMCVCVHIYLSIYLSLSLSLYIYMIYITRGAYNFLDDPCIL